MGREKKEKTCKAINAVVQVKDDNVQEEAEIVKTEIKECENIWS